MVFSGSWPYSKGDLWHVVSTQVEDQHRQGNAKQEMVVDRSWNFRVASAPGQEMRRVSREAQVQ